ncbi:MAG TPA: PASTA domain-containing protein, partial [Chitinophagaceae bacterium]|nr:PASTA domain-containing protein [Chitinophagaceae bacterium]
YAAGPDSTAYFYAGHATDIKKVLGAFNMSYADSARDSKWASVYANNYLPVLSESRIRPKQMPNVKGMGLKDALHLLENMGLKVSVSGRGKVTTQSIPAGAALEKGLTVMLELS